MTARAADRRPRSLFWQGHLTPDTSYGFLVGAFVLMGLGMGLVMSPMSTAAMNAVEPTKAGVASGILSMSRMVGGTFGVAAMGALVDRPGQRPARQLLPNLPADRRAASSPTRSAPAARRWAARSARPSQDAYVYALNNGLRIAAVVAALGALVTWLLIADKPRRPAEARRRGAPPTPPSRRRAGDAVREIRPPRLVARRAAGSDPAPRVPSRRRMHVLDHVRRRGDPPACTSAASSSGSTSTRRPTTQLAELGEILGPPAAGGRGQPGVRAAREDRRLRRPPADRLLRRSPSGATTLVEVHVHLHGDESSPSTASRCAAARDALRARATAHSDQETRLPGPRRALGARPARSCATRAPRSRASRTAPSSTRREADRRAS